MGLKANQSRLEGLTESKCDLGVSKPSKKDHLLLRNELPGAGESQAVGPEFLSSNVCVI
jgi:hypothetical protein